MMNKRSLILLFFLCCLGYFVKAQDNQVSVIINADQGEHTISKHIYGHFSEHLGRCIYDGFYVGEDNQTIPHTNGVRNDIVEALKALKIPNLRWPGGCFADTYHWKDGIGPKDQRPTIVNRWWGGTTEDNSFGLHEFLDMCELLGAEPYLSGNVGSGTVQEMIDWVQYTNHDGVSPMADLRRENGREKPWNVKYWGIGNETWGCGGNMTIEYYADIYRQYATFLPGWSSGTEITRIASGASNDDYHWTEVLMKNVPARLIEAVALHHYSVISWQDKGPDVGYTEQQYFKTMEESVLMDELIRRHVNIMDKYDPEKRVDLYVDEWGGWYDGDTEKGVLYQQSTMRDAMIAGTTLNTFNNHAERVKMANIAQAVNVLQSVILTEEEKMILTPTYHVMRMYNVHQDAMLLPSHFTKNQEYKLDDKTLPAVNISSSKDASGVVHVSIVNIDAKKSYNVSLNVRGVEFKSIEGEILRSGNLNDHNTFDNPDKIKPSAFSDVKNRKGELSLTIPPFSVIVLALK